MRGERRSLGYPKPFTTGSSPHARGTLLKQIVETVCHRFIPACAGNAATVQVYHTPVTVHPRMRGERRARNTSSCSICGSSPHARGTPNSDSVRKRFLRFIPACAGNAAKSSTRQSLLPVHPRMRGERCVRHACTCPTYGSSPHARGTPHRKAHKALLHRFIPACAGNAKCRCVFINGLAVHPRMRGERCPMNLRNHFTIGSSPHARGTHFQ